MRPLQALLWANQLGRETRAQDMIEYALIGRFHGRRCGSRTAGCRGDISSIFSCVTSVMNLAIGPTPLASLPKWKSGGI